MSIKHCGKNCKSKFQDQKYGEGYRVHTQANANKPNDGKSYCTVCNNVDGSTPKKK